MLEKPLKISESPGDEVAQCSSVEQIQQEINEFNFEEKDAGVDLDTFRQLWKEELKGRLQSHGESTENKNDEEEHKARSLFLEGVELEKQGEMAEAVQRFRRAVKMVPDIERRVFPHVPSSAKQKPRTRSASRSKSETPSSSAEESAEDLVHRLNKKVHERGLLFEAFNASQPCYFQFLPYDMQRLLMRYIVGSQLNTRNLEVLSEVSSGFYLLAREEELWRSIFYQAVGIEQAESTLEKESEAHILWRDLYLKTPHLLFDGMYSSKISYIRHGETGFQDTNYRPWHTVVYYRLIRFFADGKALMTTSNEHPQNIVSKLKHRTPPTNTSSSILAGFWFIENGDTVVCKFWHEMDKLVPKKKVKKNRCQAPVEFGVFRREFNIRFRMVPSKLPGKYLLVWLSNRCTCFYLDGEKTTFDLDSANDLQAYPPLRYYRVKSFGEETDAALE